MHHCPEPHGQAVKTQYYELILQEVMLVQSPAGGWNFTSVWGHFLLSIMQYMGSY